MNSKHFLVAKATNFLYNNFVLNLYGGKVNDYKFKYR